ncbi:predicted protein [Histoplasma capsulatum G186AR]|uniref:Uncharacterized protein n=1 Tax=Ajellomyces capsulatus (strain G186AR / H82 / ATCC MYA-2454 / RMSCC 2432) TaxID=447093 RepID=C0NUE6_AJECG|nr:uncharacterized protein HCBG_06977 [Histoplasma capsulatum G186AR]EEH05026.1 predicted protein [Histoplasma capsulatum G186AR]
MPAVMVTSWMAFQITAISSNQSGRSGVKQSRNYEDGPLYYYNELSIDDTKPEPILSIIRDCCKEIRWEDMGDFGIGVYKVALVQTAEGKSSNTTLSRDRCIYLNG